MGDVHVAKPRSQPGALNEYTWPGIGQHQYGRRVGVLGQSVQCEDCGQVCMAVHEPRLITVTDRLGVTRVVEVPGAWIGPSDDPYRHLFPMAPLPVGLYPQDNTDAQAQTMPAIQQHPSKRPAAITADMAARSKAHRASRPSRSPEARRAERARAQRRKALARQSG